LVRAKVGKVYGRHACSLGVILSESEESKTEGFYFDKNRWNMTPDSLLHSE